MDRGDSPDSHSAASASSSAYSEEQGTLSPSASGFPLPICTVRARPDGGAATAPRSWEAPCDPCDVMRPNPDRSLLSLGVPILPPDASLRPSLALLTVLDCTIRMYAIVFVEIRTLLEKS